MRVAFLIFSGFAWFISKLPDALLYRLSAFLYFVLCYIVRYRRKVIVDNLQQCFPEFNEKEISAIVKQYYQHISDLILEVMKTPGMKASAIKARFSFKNPEVLEKIIKSGKSIILAVGHQGNWEWSGPGIQLNFPALSGYAVVKPISNPDFDSYMSKLRTLHIADSLIPFKQTLRYMIKNKDKQTLTLIAADQTPHRSEINFQALFFNRQTPFFNGFGKIAMMLDQAVVFANLYRNKRGHYDVEFHLITDNPKELDENEITLRFVNHLEQGIRQRPYNWLWSHRRWKYAPTSE